MRLSLQWVVMAAAVGACARAGVPEHDGLAAGRSGDAGVDAFPADASVEAAPGDAATGKAPDASRPGDSQAGRPADPAAAREGFYAIRKVYQQVQDISGQLVVTLSGKLLNTHTTYSLATLRSDGVLVEDVCGADVVSKAADSASEIFESGIEVNPAVFETLRGLERPLELTSDGFEMPFNDVAVGWQQATPGEPIPTDAEDPREQDTDADGNPGITIELSGNLFATGQLYAVQRLRDRAVGSFEGEDLRGELFDAGEQRVLGGTILDTQQSVAPAGNAMTNRIYFAKRPEGSLTCPQLLADPGSVFPPHPVLD